MSLSNTFVVLMGLGIVFFGLICIVFLCQIMSFICKSMIKETPTDAIPSPSNANEVIPNRQEFVAAVSAVMTFQASKSALSKNSHNLLYSIVKKYITN